VHAGCKQRGSKETSSGRGTDEGDVWVNWGKVGECEGAGSRSYVQKECWKWMAARTTTWRHITPWRQTGEDPQIGGDPCNRWQHHNDADDNQSKA